VEEKKVPALRFRGFDNAWEQRHLGEIVERVTRKNENLESTLPLTISAQYGLIDQNEFFDKRIASKDVSGYFLIRRGEFAYNKSTSTDAPWGAIKCLERYENGVLSTLYIVFRIIDEKKLNSNYLAFYYDTDLWHRGVQAIAAEGARNHGLLNIAPVDFFETTLAIPQDIFEQQKIGLFFKQLDHLISLHQRKLEMLKKVKKSMLEKMFPKNDAKVPEVRFSDFTDAWEQRRLGEVCSSFDYGMNVAAKEFDGENKYIRITDIDDASREFLLRDISSPDICLEKEEVSKYLLSNGDIVFARTGASVGKTYIYKNKDGVVYFAGFLIRVKVNTENDADFIFQNTLSVNYNRYITITSQRSGQPGVNAQEYSEYSIFIPLREEQKKIGNYLCNFDHLISLHQRKLEKLKNIKKSMLEKMFII